ncbi:succinyldiaminopimelate transaminase [Lolliginicoccus levis]|uniref:succinyldiaminopimelate transaminase n=1 Tax=Lolliginicoccus levis TaxID=2919542 RepID=UPI00241BEE11|nr:succinyldiaminopimelate transaminase [Lolliginicoccus levis]
MHRTPVARALPDFPWDSLAGAKQLARSHSDGIVDLSVGTPVDPVAPMIQDALASVAAQPGYPTTHGTAEFREAAAGSMARRYGISGIDPDAVLPAIGTKELIAWLPRLLAVGSGDTVVIPELAYPTYEVGALLAGAEILRADSTVAMGPQRVPLLFINSPSNPTGRVLGVDHLRKVVEWARHRGTIVASDECYLGLGWDAEPVSILDERVSGGNHEGLLAVHSLSKTSSLASYRAGFITGDPELVGDLLAVRKHAGMMVPLPIQAAAAAAMSSDTHEQEQKEKYRQRREVLRAALAEAGFRIDHSEAGLYLWATRGEHGRDTVQWLAERGILAAPGEFYGPTGTQHVRIALTATDERIAAAARRLAP